MSKIKIETRIHAPIELVWNCWTSPEHIVNWNHASDDWHTTKAENDLRPGGKFMSRMEAKDGSFGFDFEGIYDRVDEHAYIEYHLADARVIKVEFKQEGSETIVMEDADPETMNPLEMQVAGWQAILNNFAAYVLKQNQAQ
jgi:uncharacterized protein YndB with AHSA1/START domain